MIYLQNMPYKVFAGSTHWSQGKTCKTHAKPEERNCSQRKTGVLPIEKLTGRIVQQKAVLIAEVFKTIRSKTPKTFNKQQVKNE